MKRIAIAGFQHETNTFAEKKADFDAFAMAKDWPALCEGDALIEKVSGFNLPIVGAIDCFSKEEIEIVPLCWAFAVPCGVVTRDAFERIASLILGLLESAGPVDGIYLDLHGAMVTEHYDDAEGELLRRLRMLVGSNIPISASLDYHANITEKMVEYADYLDTYRHYPHTDMAETGKRTAGVLVKLLGDGTRFNKAMYKSDFLIPLNMGCTTLNPCKTLVGEKLEKIRDSLTPHSHISFAAGFALADIEEAGPSVIAYGPEKNVILEALANFQQELVASEHLFKETGVSADKAVAMALKISETARKPVIIADTQDNPGAGGSGDTTGLLRELLSAGTQNALCGFISDSETAEMAHAAGVGRDILADLGGKGFKGDTPLSGLYTVLALANGELLATGPMWKGAQMQLGPCALLERDGVKIAVSSKTVQTGDSEMFRHLGIDPKAQSIIALKSSVHFRADFERFAQEIIVALSPGPVEADLVKLKYKKLRPGARIGPNKDFEHDFEV
ncbi:M81 family metallopeptidase [Sneathiella sp. HT1-7]|uniref:M81 family metallopeptidase n=1 Tax=Sneathiella sp. HT1-7 TaxID=2887192 RepID=UPI001D139BD5|nr:M81 family metallopeptidase [Sneathiella sp. HT1-7]MCC3306270.1 M81 family metallopeptidase [Sneathiella sp. HT1-7]